MLMENVHYKMPLSHFTNQPKRGSSLLAQESWLILTNKGHIVFKMSSSWEFEYLLCSIVEIHFQVASLCFETGSLQCTLHSEDDMLSCLLKWLQKQKETHSK